MQTTRFILWVAVMILVAACGSVAVPVSVAVQPTVEPVDTALIEQGVGVYRVNYCGSCHTLTAANTRGTFGPNHDTAGDMATVNVTLGNYAGEAKNALEYLHESVVNPSAFYTPGYEASNHHMPAFKHLPDEDIEALVYLLFHQRG